MAFKKKKSKADLFGEAIDDEIKSSKKDSKKNTGEASNLKQFNDISEIDAFEPTNKSDNPENIDKRLDSDKKNKKKAPMEEALKNIDKELNSSSNNNKKVKYENGSSKTSTVIAVIVLTLAIIAGYFYFTGEVTKPGILLSTTPISEANYQSFKTEKLIFSLGKPIYIYFVTGGRLGVDHVNINILEEIKVNNQKSYELIGNVKASTKPNWRNFDTHFQKDYFRNPGNYKIQLLNSTGKILIENKFVIK